MLDKTTFWKSAFQWGCFTGTTLFVVELINWALGMKPGGWFATLLSIIILCAIILITGRQNAALAGARVGYPYSRAIGFVMDMMLFAGLVYGIGMYFFYNFIAPQVYEEIIAKSMAMMPAGSEDMVDRAVSMMRSPVVLILQGIAGMIFRGGFLGLVVCAFVTRKPDIFSESE